MGNNYKRAANLVINNLQNPYEAIILLKGKEGNCTTVISTVPFKTEKKLLGWEVMVTCSFYLILY